MAVPPEELRELRVLETWKDGRRIFPEVGQASAQWEKNPCIFPEND